MSPWHDDDDEPICFSTKLPGPDPRANIPPHDCSDDEARQLVESSALRGLQPGQPGVSAKTWQELATVAVGKPDIRWLGQCVYSWGDDEDDNYMVDMNEVHKFGPQTELRKRGHRKRFGEKALKYGGIDIVRRTLADFPRDEPVGYHGVFDLFYEAKMCRGLVSQRAKIEYFLRHYHVAVEPRLKELAQQKLDGELASWYESQTEEANAAYSAARARRAALASSLGLTQVVESKPPPRPTLIPPPSVDAVKNSLLAWCIAMSDGTIGVADAAIQALRRLNAQLVFDTTLAPSTAGLTGTLGGCATGWQELLSKQGLYMAFFLHAALRAGGSFRACARADAQTAKHVLRTIQEYEHERYEHPVELHGGSGRPSNRTLVAIAQALPRGEEIMRLCVERRAFDDEGLARACNRLRRPPPKLTNAQFDAKRDLDALRTVAGVRPKTQPKAMPTEPLELVAAWMCAD